MGSYKSVPSLHPPIHSPNLTSSTLGPPIPANYTTPSFPSLYWPISPSPDEPQFLYYSNDIWHFTLLWTLALYAGFHLASGVYAFFMMPSKMSLGIPVVFAIVGGIEATMAGSIVGLM